MYKIKKGNVIPFKTLVQGILDIEDIYQIKYVFIPYKTSIKWQLYYVLKKDIKTNIKYVVKRQEKRWKNA